MASFPDRARPEIPNSTLDCGVFFCTLRVAEVYTIFSALTDESRHGITKGNDREVQQAFTETDSYAFTKVVKGERILATLIDNDERLKNHI